MFRLVLIGLILNVLVQTCIGIKLNSGETLQFENPKVFTLLLPSSYTYNDCIKCSELIAKLDQIIRQNEALATLNTDITTLLNLQNTQVANAATVINNIQQLIDNSVTNLQNIINP